MKKEQIVVTLTTWSARIRNIPKVLDTIFSQTLPPDIVVLNLAHDELVPQCVNKYIEDKHVVIQRVDDTKVYKKLLPTLNLYPDACVISIDDDMLYPTQMIEDFMRVHKRYPNSPISGNRQEYEYINCHCGCASLTKRVFFGNLIDMIDADLIENCYCDDLVYTYLMAINGLSYKRTKYLYFTNLKSYNAISPYSDNNCMALDTTWQYLQRRFGTLDNILGLSYLIKRLHRKITRKCSWVGGSQSCDSY